MVPSKISRVKRVRDGGDRMLLDEKRLKAIRRRIADGYYNRKEVSRSIVERLASQLLEDCEEPEP
jgi:anti-sigma28 factor (negative regulator of flagellin synthesis)